MISSIANLVYELPHGLSNDLRFRFLGNKDILGKSQIWVETFEKVYQFTFEKLSFSNSSQKHAKVDIKLFLSCAILLEFSIFFQIFCQGL